jgi:hypothetical protein
LLLAGIGPGKLKIAKVVPSYEKDDQSLTCNYRPILLSRPSEKLVEKSCTLIGLHNFLT